MIKTLFYTVLNGSEQILDLSKRGDKYFISITKGAFLIFPQTKEEFETAHSALFNTYDEAFAAYTCLLSSFGRGDYDWESRKANVIASAIVAKANK